MSTPRPHSGPFWYPLRGNSMAPALCDGDLLLLSPIQELRKGDVVVIRGPEGWLVHRLHRLGKNRVQTRGDACIHADRPVVRKLVLYVVTRFRREGVETPVPRPMASPRLGWRRLRTLLRDRFLRSRVRPADQDPQGLATVAPDGR